MLIARVVFLLLGLAFVAPGAAPAQEELQPDTLTPDGAATLYWLSHAGEVGPCSSDKAIVWFTVRVADGGKAGRVRPVVVHRHDDGAYTMVRAGQWVDLPATAGSHRLRNDLLLRGPCVRPRERAALEQETGGHRIVKTHESNGSERDDPAKLNYVLVWQPPLAQGAAAAPSEARAAQQLLVTWEYEPDEDRDGLGDRTRDPNPPPPCCQPAEPPPALPPPPPPPPAEQRSTPPPVGATLARRQRSLATGLLRATLSAPRRGTVVVRARLPRGLVARWTVRFATAGEQRVSLRLPTAARRALRGRRSATAAVTVTLPGSAPVRRQVVLTRR